MAEKIIIYDDSPEVFMRTSYTINKAFSTYQSISFWYYLFSNWWNTWVTTVRGQTRVTQFELLLKIDAYGYGTSWLMMHLWKPGPIAKSLYGKQTWSSLLSQGPRACQKSIINIPGHPSTTQTRTKRNQNNTRQATTRRNEKKTNTFNNQHTPVPDPTNSNPQYP